MTHADAEATPRRVLIVDADPSFGHSLGPELEKCAFTVEIAVTPAEALSRVATNPPDLVVLDLHLPDGDVVTMIRRWRTEAPALIVILVSGHASLGLVVEALSEGASGFLTKPVTAASLLDQLRERGHTQRPYLSPLVAADQPGAAALRADGVDRFFAISPDLLSVSGFDGYFKMLNPAWETTLGFTLDELYATPYLDLVHPDDRDKATDEALDICCGQTVFRFKNRYRCKDGSYRWLAWSAAPFPAHRLIYASARDVTKSVRMEQGLRAANQRLNDAVTNRELLLRASKDENDLLIETGKLMEEHSAMLVHDLRNPLTVIVANYDYILEGFEGSADCLQALRDSKHAGERMLRLLTNLVDLERLESGTLELRADAVSPMEILQSIAEERRVLARSRHVAIVLLPSPDMTLVADADLLTRTLENLVDHALRSSPAGGTVEVEGRASGSHVEIRIGHSGTPIPIALRTTVFDKPEHPDVGVGRMKPRLGLYFSHLAVSAQGGTIWIEESDRSPTVFCIRLPCAPASDARHGATGPGPATGPQS